jgi:hypothetical protein
LQPLFSVFVLLLQPVSTAQKSVINSTNMQRFIFSLLFCCFVSGIFAQIQTPAASPTATTTQMVGLSKVTIEYSRPAVKGRKIFGDLVAFGKVWRTGANKIPNITFDKDVLVNGQKIAAGKYGFCTIPGKTEWTLIFNSDGEQWGTYNYDQKKDVARLTAKPVKIAKQEHFTMAFDNFTANKADIVISWETTSVRFSVEHNAKDQIMAEIASKTADANATADTYYDAASYYLENNLDINKAAMWADKLVEKDKQYWTLGLRARILAKAGQCERAAADAQMSMEMAKKDNDDAYVKMAQKVLAQCGKK